jgi:predicted secreted protein with PEFG-CTERM motif
MDYKIYTLMAILLGSVALISSIGTTYATTTNATTTNATTTNATTTNATTTNATTTNATAADWLTFELNVGGQTYPIQYMIEGVSVNNMTISNETNSLIVSINSTDVGTLDIRLPRNVIDATTDEGSDAPFVAFIDDAELVEPGEPATTADMRTLSIGFPPGAEKIEITGTSVVPEFSTIAVVVLAIAIIGIVIATARHGRFTSSPRM